jgi:exodeoxyribonuclease-3
MPTELDVYKPERWLDDALFRPEVRAAFRALTKQGWTDALRSLHPGEQIFTFWDYFRNAYARNAGLRIDHLLVSPAIAGRLTGAGVDREVRGWEDERSRPGVDGLKDTRKRARRARRRYPRAPGARRESAPACRSCYNSGWYHLCGYSNEGIPEYPEA